MFKKKFTGFKPVQNFILLIGTVEWNEQKKKSFVFVVEKITLVPTPDFKFTYPMSTQDQKAVQSEIFC